MMEPKTVSTITSASRLFSSAARATSSTSSALVIFLLCAAHKRRLFFLSFIILAYGSDWPQDARSRFMFEDSKFASILDAKTTGVRKPYSTHKYLQRKARNQVLPTTSGL